MATTLVPEHLNTEGARLPAAYKAAKAALARCGSIDECQSWANKAQALASYARQADGDTLHKQALRIQSRAVRRCGELLKELDGRGGDRSDPPARGGGDRREDAPASKSKGDLTFAPTQRAAAEAAGMSLHQERTAVRVANVPLEASELAVESEEPPMRHKMHTRDPLSRSELAGRVGVADDVLTFWIRRGLLRPVETGMGRGRHLRFPFYEANVATVMRLLRECGLNIDALTSVAHIYRQALTWGSCLGYDRNDLFAAQDYAERLSML